MADFKKIDLKIGTDSQFISHYAEYEAGTIFGSTSPIAEDELEASVQAKLNTVFIGTYGTSTYAEITAAVAAGKVIAIKYTSSDTKIFYFYYKGKSDTHYLFECPMTATGSLAGYSVVKVDSSNTWSGDYGLANTKEDASNKTNTIDSSSTTTQYPSASAVYNALQGSSLPAFPTFDPDKKYILGIKPNTAGTAYETYWLEDTLVRGE